MHPQNTKYTEYHSTPTTCPEYTEHHITPTTCSEYMEYHSKSTVHRVY